MPGKKQKPKKPTYYWMSCRCKLHAKDVKRRYNNKFCTKHGGILVRRTRCCEDCEKELELPAKGNGKTRCPEHEILYRRSTQQAANKKRNALKPKKAKKKKKVKIAKPKKVKIAKLKPVKTEKPIKIKKPAVKKKMIGFSVDNRGDYCRSLNYCRITKRLDCASCNIFSPLFKGVDPMKVLI